MKAILITIKPQHLCNILNGKKLGEVRKNKALINAIKKEIAEKGKATIYCICSKSGENLTKLVHIGYEILSNFELKNATKVGDVLDVLNGKVVCKFECEKVERIHYYKHIEPECDIGIGVLPSFEEEDYCGSEKEYEDHCWIYAKSKLSYDELDKYLNKKVGYFIHISNLKIFDEPKEIGELKSLNKCKGCSIEHCCNIQDICRLNKAPQNFCYIEV